MITPATTAALIAANSANNSGTSDPKAYLAIYISICLICIATWLYSLFEYYLKKIKGTKLFDYIFTEGLGFACSMVFLLINCFVGFILLVFFVMKLL
jgi:hypothetical protein